MPLIAIGLCASQPKLRYGTALTLALVVAWSCLTPPAAAFTIREDANGFVVMEAENFDLNLTQDNGEWQFDNSTALWAAFDGWGYMKALAAAVPT